MDKITVGIIGFGLSGKYFHFPFLNSDNRFVIKSICSSKVQEINDLNSEIVVTQDPLKIIHNPDIDLIINTAPNIYHYSYTKEALLNGKHVVVEKPFVTNSKDGKELIELAKSKNLQLSVFHNRRWDADFLTIQKLLTSQKLGNIKYFESHFDRWNPLVRLDRWREKPQTGAGILFDLGSHLIDQALVLFGSPKTICADIAIQKNGAQADDYFHLILSYQNLKVILHSTTFSNTTPRFQIFGDLGCFTKFGFDPQENQLKNNLSPLDTNFGVESPTQYGQLTLPESHSTLSIQSEVGSYKSYYHLLFEKIMHNRGELPVTGDDALKVIQLIELAQQSSQLGKSLHID